MAGEKIWSAYDRHDNIICAGIARQVADSLGITVASLRSAATRSKPGHYRRDGRDSERNYKVYSFDPDE